MKITSSCEREFILRCITTKKKRLDGRSLIEGRTLNIIFGQEWGCCLVQLGNTQVLAQVSAEVSVPKSNSPTEGALHLNLELSPMCAPDVNLSRNSNEAIESQRSLERCIRDSKCIDLESLCIIAGAKVWTIRVDIHSLNDDGNLLECSSIAAISALAHFKRPDVTVVGTEVTIHSLDDREPVCLNLHHMPISVCLALFEQGQQILVDPTDIEEKIADGCYIIGINAHQEICFVHRRGVLLLIENVIKKCEDIAVKRVQTVTQTIRAALDDDLYKRETKAPIGFVNLLKTGTILGAKHMMHQFDMKEIEKKEKEVETINVNEDVEVEEVRKTSNVTVSAAKENAMRILETQQSAVFEGGRSKWGVDNEDSTSSEDEKVPIATDPITPVKDEELSSEEEEMGFIEGEQVDVKPSGYRKWYSKSPFS